MENYFTKLNSIDVNAHTEKKNNLTYLSWTWAWQEIKKAHPDAVYTIYENKDGWNYFTDGKTCWVKTGVTINSIEHIEYLPVMDYKNKSIPLDNVTSFDVNKTIQRSLTKACARHGLGLYIYAGEDLPEETKQEKTDFEKDASKEKAANTKALHKAVAEGVEYQRKEPEKTLEDRYNKAIVYLNSQTQDSFKLAKPSVIDSINNLVTDLTNKGCSGWAEKIQSKFNELSGIENFDFNFNNQELKDYRV